MIWKHFPNYCPFPRESTGYHLIPLTTEQPCVSLLITEQAFETRFDVPLIWDTIALMWRNSNMWRHFYISLRWRHNGWDGVSNHQPHDCLLNRLFWRRSKKTSKPGVTGLCAGNSSGTGEFPAQMASNAETVSIRWRHQPQVLCCRWLTSSSSTSLLSSRNHRP